jgi:uncharacterized protein
MSRETGQPVDLSWRAFERRSTSAFDRRSSSAVAPHRRDKGQRRSQYLTMRDGVRLGVDIHLPATYASGDRLPTILRQTRYFRSVEIAAPLDGRFLRDAIDIAARTRERFLARGYAWVDVDVRGSGVSGGSWPLPWSQAEVTDGGEVVDFIVAQPWSSGLVGSTGISYDGTTAEMLLCNQREAVRAVAPRFSLFCAYEDVAFPGGAHLAWFTERWARFNLLLDAHRFHEAMAELIHVIARGRAGEPDFALARPLRLLLDTLGDDRAKRAIASVLGAVYRGPRRVDDDIDGRERARAIADHLANGDVHELCLQAMFRDDTKDGRSDLAFGTVSPKTNAAAIAGSGASIYSYGGFLDGAYGQSAARRHATLPGGRLLLGPWGHAGVIAHDPFGEAAAAGFDHDGELLSFFDVHLKNDDDGSASDPPVRYFTFGDNRWRSANEWPPRDVAFESRYLRADRRLLSARPTASSTHRVAKTSFGSGERSRWRGVLAAFVPADYPDIAARTANETSFDTAPFEAPRRLTGHPSVHLIVRANAADFVVVAYLLAVAPDGRVIYLSEGQLRALHRGKPDDESHPRGPERSFARADAAPVEPGRATALDFSLLPVSAAIPAGYRLRLVVTLGDRDHFADIDGAREIEILSDDRHASRVDLPFATEP